MFYNCQFLSACDYVVYIPGGRRTPVYGSHEQLMEMTGGEYAAVISSASQQQQQRHREHRTDSTRFAGQCYDK